MRYLPELYLSDMKELLGDAYGEFLACYEKPAVKGLRFNRKKARPKTVEKLLNEWKLEPVPWCPMGYYYPEEVRPGLSPYHDTGLYYMQEPSAMSVVEEAEIGSDDVVLDLCAAPGGKSTAAAERCAFLISNEIIPNRAKILSSNIERMGFDNVIVTNASPDRLCEALPEAFSVVLVDAPCSGEGMMRRDEIAVQEWSEENVANCIERQKEILNEAAKSVAPGGKLVYSTCTFDRGENEEQIRNFLSAHPDFSLLREKRLMPHEVRGEGHYVAVLQKEDNLPKCSVSDTDESAASINRCKTHNSKSTAVINRCMSDDCKSNHNKVKHNNSVAEEPDTLRLWFERNLQAAGVHILRSGVVRGEYFTDKKKKQIYEPSHAEIMASCYDSVESGVNLLSEAEALKFLRGEVLRLDNSEEQKMTGAGKIQVKGPEGFCGVYFDGYPLGLGKRQGEVVKNHLPKGLRR